MFYYNLIICSLSVIFWVYLIYAAWEMAHKRAPFVPSIGNPRKIALKKITTILNNKKTPQTIVDAGCGNGKLLATLAKQFPQHNFIGIEYNKILYNYCRQHYQKQQNLAFLNQDLLKFDYNQANIVYYFGLPSLTLKFEEKLRQLPAKIDLITLDAEFSNLNLIDKELFKFWFVKSYIYHYKN